MYTSHVLKLVHYSKRFQDCNTKKMTDIKYWKTNEFAVSIAISFAAYNKSCFCAL